MINQKYPLSWKKKDFSIKIFCSIPNIATGILLRAGDSHFVVDPGDGILRDLNSEIGTKNILKISDVFVTHGHHDHVGGVWSLLTYLRVMRKSSPLVIHYPKGCVEIESIHSAFERVYSGSISYKIILKTIKDAKSFKRKNVTIKPFPVVHKENVYGLHIDNGFMIAKCEAAIGFSEPGFIQPGSSTDFGKFGTTTSRSTVGSSTHSTSRTRSGATACTIWIPRRATASQTSTTIRSA